MTHRTRPSGSALPIAVRGFCRAAQETFAVHIGKSGGDDDPHRYIHRDSSVHLTHPSGEKFQRAADHLDPFILLTALRNERTANHYEDQTHLAPPFVALLIGPYGTGKSEFVHRVCQFLDDFRSDNRPPPLPLPIPLARCRPRMKALTAETTAEEFETLILGDPVAARGVARGTRQKVAQAVREGGVFLILDALDELVDHKEQHGYFFAGLRQFLAGGADRPACRVLVTMREEYFQAVEGAGHGEDDKSADRPPEYIVLDKLLSEVRLPLNVALIEVDYFTDEQIYHYLKRSLAADARSELGTVYQSLARRPNLFSTLHRPLLLKVFTDLIKKQPTTALAGFTEGTGHPADLIKQYVEQIDDDARPRQYGVTPGEGGQSSYPWDTRRLAERCMGMFGEGRNALTGEEVAWVLNTPKNLDRAFEFVHKCSFLIRDLNEVRFSHRVFFEYFTARGVVDQMEELVRKGQPPDDSEALNEYVLNSDTRKFLRHMTHASDLLRRGGHTFHSVTKRSCGLTGPERDRWPEGRAWFEKHEARLSEIQGHLLDGMTAPDPREVGERRDDGLASADKVSAAVRWFLDQDHTLYHPLYLVYCYHAVGTFLKPRWLDPVWAASRGGFDTLLRETLSRAVRHTAGPPADSEPWQHLVERILFLAGWLRLRWVADWLAEHPTPDWLIANWEGKSKARLERILGGISDVCRTAPLNG